MTPYNSQQAGKTFNSNTQNTSNNRNPQNRNQYNRNSQNNRFASLQSGNPTGYRDNNQRDNGRRDGKKPYYQKGDNNKKSDDQENQKVQITFNTGKTSTNNTTNNRSNNKPKNGFAVFVDDGKNQKSTNYKKDYKTDNQTSEEQRILQQQQKQQQQQEHNKKQKEDTILQNRYKYRNVNKDGTLPEGVKLIEVKPFIKPGLNQTNVIDQFNGEPVMIGRSPNPFAEYEVIEEEDDEGKIIGYSYREINRHPINIIRQIRFTETDENTQQVENVSVYDIFDIYSLRDTLQMIIAIPPKVPKPLKQIEKLNKAPTDPDVQPHINTYIENKYIKHVLQQFAKQSENTYIKGYSTFALQHIRYMKKFVMDRSDMFIKFMQHVEQLNEGSENLPQLSFTIPKFQEIYSRSYVVEDGMFSIKVIFDKGQNTSRTYFFKAGISEKQKEKKDDKGNVIMVTQRSYSKTDFQIYQSVAFSRDMEKDFKSNKFVNGRKITIKKANYAYTKVNKLIFIDYAEDEMNFDKMYIAKKNGTEVTQREIANNMVDSFDFVEEQYFEPKTNGINGIPQKYNKIVTDNKAYVEFLMDDDVYIQRSFIRNVLLQVKGLIKQDGFYTWNFFKYIPYQTQSEIIRGPGLTDSDLDRRIFDVSDVLLILQYQKQFGSKQIKPFFDDFRTKVREKINDAKRYDVNYYSYLITTSMKEFVNAQLDVKDVYKMIKNIFDNWDRTKIYTKSLVTASQPGEEIIIQDPYYPELQKYKLYYIDPSSLIGTETEKKYYVLFKHDAIAKCTLVSNNHMILYEILQSQTTSKTQMAIMNKFKQIKSYKQLKTEFENNVKGSRFTENIVNSTIYNDKQKEQLYYMIYWLTYIYIENTELMDSLYNDNNPVFNEQQEKKFIEQITPWVRFYKMFMLSLTVQNKYGGFQYFNDRSRKTLPTIQSFHSMFTILDDVQKSLDVNMLKYNLVEKDKYVYKDATTNYDKITLGFQNEFILPNAVKETSGKSIEIDNGLYGVSYTVDEIIPEKYIANGKDYYRRTDCAYPDKPNVKYDCIVFYNKNGSVQEIHKVYKEYVEDGDKYLIIGEDEKKVKVVTLGTDIKIENGIEIRNNKQQLILEKEYECQRYDHLRYIFGYSQMFDQFYKDTTHGKYNGFLFDGIPNDFRQPIQTTIQDMFNLSPRIKYNIFMNTAIGLDYKLKPELQQQVVFEYDENTGTHNLAEFIDQYQPSGTYDRFCKGENPQNNNNSNKNDKQ